jgi:lysophospholipase
LTGDPALADPPAPFDHATARAVPDACAVWRVAADGTRLRMGVLGRGEAGTILLVTGRTEYLEKYGSVAARFAQAGYGTVSFDTRGQGLSDRPLAEGRIGHVARFADYQHDVDALVAFAAAQAMPRPWVVLGHSMGGAIALRALMGGLDVAGAVFSAPMWGIAMNPALRPVAWGLGWIAHRAGLNRWVTPGTKIDTYVRICDPADNFLTDDPAEIAQMRAQLDAVPGLDLGGPSVPWLYRALVECADLQRHADPGVPSLTFLPERDEIVSQAAMRAMTARWRDAALVAVPRGRHETMMEIPERRELFFDRTLAFLRSLD